MADTPDFDNRPTIRLDHTLPENPKIVGLTDAAFRLYVEIICFCSRQETDGIITAAMMRRLAKPRPLAGLMEVRLILPHPDGFEVRDYLKHQRSAAEIASFRAARSASGTKGAHMRWHVPTRRTVRDCTYCQEAVHA